MKTLLEHFKAMQGQASRYLEPAPYVMVDGTMINGDDTARTAAFIVDVVRMLDGPEQRDVQEHAESAVAQLAQAEDWRMDLRKQIAQGDEVAKEWRKAAQGAQTERDALRKQCDSLRADVARLGGMLDMLRELGMVPPPKAEYGQVGSPFENLGRRRF